MKRKQTDEEKIILLFQQLGAAEKEEGVAIDEIMTGLKMSLRKVQTIVKQLLRANFVEMGDTRDSFILTKRGVELADRLKND